MGKIKSIGYQIYSALNEINLQDSDKRTEVFNKLNHTELDYVGKREFKELGQTKEYIFSKRTAENTVEKSKCFTKFLKENYGIKLAKEITPDMAIAFLKTKEGCSAKTITAYKNMLYKVDYAIQLKFGAESFYTDTVANFKPESTYKSISTRLYSDNQIKQILSAPSDRANEMKAMALIGCRVHELINLKKSDIDFHKHTIHIIGKGGKVSFRPLTPQAETFLKNLTKNMSSSDKLFKLPTDEKVTRQIMSNEIRRITKSLDLPVSGKNHEFRKYAAQQFCNYLIQEKGWEKEKAREYVSSKFLAHGAGREDIKKIYLDSWFYYLTIFKKRYKTII